MGTYTQYNVIEKGFMNNAAFKAAEVFAPVAISDCYVNKSSERFHGVGMGLYASKVEKSTSAWREKVTAGTVGRAALTRDEAAENAAHWDGEWEVRPFPVTERYWTHGCMSSPKNGKIVLCY